MFFSLFLWCSLFFSPGCLVEVFCFFEIVFVIDIDASFFWLYEGYHLFCIKRPVFLVGFCFGDEEGAVWSVQGGEILGSFEVAVFEFFVEETVFYFEGPVGVVFVFGDTDEGLAGGVLEEFDGVVDVLLGAEG